MNRTRKEILDWESRWSVPTGIVALVAVALILAGNFVSGVSGNGSAEILRSTYEHKSGVALSGAFQAVGFALLAAPLYFLFRAARSRSDRVRSQLVGLVLVAPLFLALSAGLSINVRQQAADTFHAGEAKATLSAKEAGEECNSELKDKGKEGFTEEYEPAAGETATAACRRTKVEDNEADQATSDASVASLAAGLGLAGSLGFIAVFAYTGLWAMRTGLLSRFWGTLGMVSGIAFVLGPLFIITAVWIVYVGLLLIGKLPNARPPAWAAGEAVPWPTPGEKAAAEMEPKDGDVIDVDAVEEEPAEDSGADAGGGPPRKRKQRD